MTAVAPFYRSRIFKNDAWHLKFSSCTQEIPNEAF